MADNAVRDSVDSTMGSYFNDLSALHLSPLWQVLDDLVPEEPRPPARPAIWRYRAVRDLLMRAGALISAEEAVRRVLILENPGLVGAASITRSLYAGLQLVLPGEIAPCHRHAQSALRFVLDGDGAHTAVDGEKVLMRKFDLVLTPSGAWHDHGNESAAPMIWLDGLDIPLLQTLDCGYVQVYEAPFHPETRPAGDSLMRFGRNMRPATSGESGLAAGTQPLFHYPHEEWRSVLETMVKNDKPHAHDGYKMEFINPVTGGSVMPTISAFCQLIPAGFETAKRRSTDGTVYAVCEGAGTVRIGAEKFDLSPADVFVAPSWSEVVFEPSKELVLFSFSDKAVQERLGLWREQLC